MNRIVRMYWIARALGLRNLPRRLWREFKLRTGILQRQLPGRELTQAEMRKRFVRDYDPAQAFEHWQKRSATVLGGKPLSEYRDMLCDLVDEKTWQEHVGRRVDGIERGQFEMFSHLVVDVGLIPDFNRDPIHETQWPTGQHWTTYKQFDPERSDLKCVWELSRFTWAYHLARHAARTGSTKPRASFWRLFDAWEAQNPYGQTPQWVCGQEATFRMMAWIFATSIFSAMPGGESGSYQRMTELVYYVGRHIEKHIGYARSQGNNHAISEAVGLITIGNLFPELVDSGRWDRIGRRVLEAEVKRQVLADGSYVQHSFNYHRLMMDDLLWLAMVLPGGLGDLPAARSALERATRFLAQFVCVTNGRVPNYGANDGALILPLSCGQYIDYRPVLSAASAVTCAPTPFAIGPWDEAQIWVTHATMRSQAGQQAVRASVYVAPEGGYYLFRGPKTQLMTRCHSYRTRPSQSDMLHVDLWADGENVLSDAGSYSYFAAGASHRWFKSTAAHNTIEVDEQSQMIGGPGFLWLRWLTAQCLTVRSGVDNRVSVFKGEHSGYKRLLGEVVHCRTILRADDSYAVIDDICGDGQHLIALRWRLQDIDWSACGADNDYSIRSKSMKMDISCSTTADYRLIRGTTDSTEGWSSSRYCSREPAPTVLAQARGALPIRFVTTIAIGAVEIKATKPIDGYDPVRISVSDRSLLAALRSNSCGVFCTPGDPLHIVTESD